jgi:hypothetical protein
MRDKRITINCETARTREEIKASSFDAAIQHPASRVRMS